MQNELTAERIERAIKEISESGMYGNQVHQETMETCLAALRAEQERNKGCDFCHRGKPIKAHTIMPDSKMQYKASVEAKFCPMCGRRLTEGSENND